MEKDLMLDIYEYSDASVLLMYPKRKDENWMLSLDAVSLSGMVVM